VADVQVGDIFQVSFKGSIFGTRILLVHHYRASTVPAGLGVIDATEELLDGVRAGVGGDDLLETDYLACLPPEYALDQIVAQLVSSRYRRLVYNAGTTGTHAASTEASNQAAVITLQTDNAGRSQISNKHIGPLPQDVSVQDEGELTVAYKTILGTLLVGLLTPVSQIGGTLIFDPVIWHKNEVVNFSMLSAGYVQDTLRTMRRRTLFLGE